MALQLKYDLVKKLISEQQARASAEREVQSREEFLALVAHELRTPLNAIVGWAQIVAQGVNAETLDRALGVIIRSAEAQERIISDLYDAASISKGKFTVSLKLLNLLKTIAEAVETVLPSATAKKICIKQRFGEGDLMVYGDEGRLQQVICNLLNNAVQFTPEMGTISILCGLDRHAAQITISDTGCGIKTEILPKVFDYAFQASSGNGLGFGLSIARHIVERHGGTISVESFGANQGTTFTVRLPIAEVF
jgi:signal transduction histidine kinase